MSIDIKRSDALAAAASYNPEITHSDVLDAVASYAVPATMREIIDALGADRQAAEVRATVTRLVNGRKLERCHSPDGLLRYSATCDEEPGADSDRAEDRSTAPTHTDAASDPVDHHAPPPQVDPRPVRHELSVADRVSLVARIIRDAEAPIAMRDIAALTSEQMLYRDVPPVLQKLRRMGCIIRLGDRQGARWWHSDRAAELAQASKPAPPAVVATTMSTPAPAPSSPEPASSVRYLVDCAYESVHRALKASLMEDASPALSSDLAGAYLALHHARERTNHGSTP